MPSASFDGLNHRTKIGERFVNKAVASFFAGVVVATIGFSIGARPLVSMAVRADTVLDEREVR